MKTRRQWTAFLILLVFLSGAVFSPAAAFGAPPVLSASQTGFLGHMLRLQGFGVFARWTATDQQAFVAVLLEYGVLEDALLPKALLAQTLSSEQAEALCTQLLFSHYSQTSFTSFLEVLAADWPRNIRGRKMIETGSQAIALAHGIMTAYFHYSVHILKTFVFTAGTVAFDGQDEPVWLVMAKPGARPYPVYHLYFAQDGTPLSLNAP